MITMPNFLAIDAGGTSTRAAILNSSGLCLGYGTAGGGNPVSRGFEPALEALTQASAAALGDAPAPFSEVLLAMAGASLELPTQLFRDRFATLGLAGNVMIESDLLAAFYSGTHHDHGCALIAGTGAVGARIAGSRLAAVADGTGWLLGDAGAGFWLGREVARAVASALDGRGQATSLTGLVLAELDITLDPGARTQGRLRAQQQLILKVYERSAIELSRFAPLVFAAPDDIVARDIIERAAQALARTLLAVSEGASDEAAADGAAGDGPGQAVPLVPPFAGAALPGAQAAGAGSFRMTDQPLIFGGSVLTKGGTVASAVVDLLTAGTAEPAGTTEPITPVLVEDGMVGAAVLVLKRNGIEVDASVFARIQGSLAALR